MTLFLSDSVKSDTDKITKHESEHMGYAICSCPQGFVAWINPMVTETSKINDNWC